MLPSQIRGETPEKRVENDATQAELNKIALRAVLEAYQEIGYKTLQEIAGSRPSEFASVANVHGLRCVVCKGRLTLRNIEFANFNPERSKCFHCFASEQDLSEQL